MLLSKLHVLITGDNRDAVEALRETQAETQRASTGMATAAKGAAIGIAGIAAAGAAFGGITAAVGLQQAGASEQAQIAFETMLGSAEKAEEFLGGLKEFAASTPFEFPELRTAASSLISAGIEADKVIPIMTTLGDVTSGMGTGAEGVQRATVALQQMNAAGRITGEDLNQLRDAGIPVYDLLAAATGKSKEAVTALAQAGKLGKVELEQLMGALESGAGLEKFNGLMEKQSQSLFGLLSTLKDTVMQDLGDAAAPLVDLAKQALPEVTAAIASVTGGLGPMMVAIGEIALSLVPLIQPIAALLSDVAEVVAQVLGSAVEALGPVIAALVPVIGEVMSILGDGLAEVLPEIGAAFLALVQAVGPLIPKLLDLALSVVLPLISQLAKLVPVIVDVASAFLGPLVDALGTLAEAFGPVVVALGGALMEVLEEIRPSLAQVGENLAVMGVALLPLVPALGELLIALVPIIPPLVQIITLVGQFTAAATAYLGPALAGIIGWVAELIEWLRPAIDLISELVAGVASITGLDAAFTTGNELTLPGLPGSTAAAMSAAALSRSGAGMQQMGATNITIQDARNPEATAQAVATELQKAGQQGTRTLRQTRGRG